jgi:outer membrane lipoprotein-sorting protein
MQKRTGALDLWDWPSTQRCVGASLLAVALFVFQSRAHAEEAGTTKEQRLSATEVIERAELALWGKTFQADFDMTITTPSWSRNLSLLVQMDRPGKSLLRVSAPAKDAGISSLRLGTEMWNYIPAIERTIKIPPSLMLQPWLGSDFTNDDLVKESSLVDDYTHKLVESPKPDGSGRYLVEALPKPDSAVVWGKIMYAARADFVPLKQEYFDERGHMVRALTYSDIRRLDDREVPTQWEMKPADKPGKSTTIRIKQAKYNKPLDDALFSLRSLTRKK